MMELVKNLLMLILFCAEIEHMKGMRADGEEENPPDGHIIYDQRQSGKYNIHVVIKDVAIIEMDQNEIADQNYNDEEYYYDEEDLTVKPLKINTTTTSTNKPLADAENDKTTHPSVQTTMSMFSLESQNNTSINISKETTELNSSANFSKPGQETVSNSGTLDLISFLTTHQPATETKSRSKVEPIYAVDEPAFQARRNLEDFNYVMQVAASARDSSLARENSRTFANSKIFKVKIHRSNRATQITPHRERCSAHQYRDGRGNCRGKRTSSGTILKRLFRMLLALPFRQDQQNTDDER